MDTECRNSLAPSRSAPLRSDFDVVSPVQPHGDEKLRSDPNFLYTTATFTQWIGGSESNRQPHSSPPSRPIQSWPVVVPK